MKAARDDAGAIQAAEQAARIAPDSPEAWRFLAALYGALSGGIRRGRFWNDMTEEEQTSLTAMYAKWLQGYRKAVQIDPNYGECWREAATAATFAGNTEFADKAFWKAVQTDHGDAVLYGWGLEMYQAKWGGDPAKLVKVANAAAADTYATPDITHSMADKLFSYGYSAQASQLYARIVPLYGARLQKQPDDTSALSHLAMAFTRLGRMEEATQAYQFLTQLRPDDAGYRAALAYAYFSRNRPDDAIREYRETLRLQPNSPVAHAYLGFSLKSKTLYDQAEPEFRAAIALNPGYADPHFGLGDVYYFRKQYPQAIAEYRETIRLNPQALSAYKNLSAAYCETKQFDSALQMAKFEVQLAPNDDDAHTMLGYVYLALKDTPNSVGESRAAIRLNPKNANAHVNLGDALVEMGFAAAARAEWLLVLALDHGDAAKEAREMLSKYP